MKKIVKKHICLLAIVFAFGIALVSCSKTKTAVVDKVLEVQVNEMNKSCPVVIAPGITLLNTEVLGGSVLKYNYKIDVVNDSLLSDTTQLKNTLKPQIITSLKSLADIKQLNELGVSLLYEYKDTNGKYLYQINITPEEYKAQ